MNSKQLLKKKNSSHFVSPLQTLTKIILLVGGNKRFKMEIADLLVLREVCGVELTGQLEGCIRSPRKNFAARVDYLSAETLINNIRSILQHWKSHPGCTSISSLALSPFAKGWAIRYWVQLCIYLTVKLIHYMRGISLPTSVVTDRSSSWKLVVHLNKKIQNVHTNVFLRLSSTGLSSVRCMVELNFQIVAFRSAQMVLTILVNILYN